MDRWRNYKQYIYTYACIWKRRIPMLSCIINWRQKKKTNNATKIFNNTSHINNLNSRKFNVNNKVTLKFSGLFLI